MNDQIGDEKHDTVILIVFELNRRLNAVLENFKDSSQNPATTAEMI